MWYWLVDFIWCCCNMGNYILKYILTIIILSLLIIFECNIGWWIPAGVVIGLIFRYYKGNNGLVK